MGSPEFQLIDAGVSDYQTLYARQRELVEKKKSGEIEKDLVILVEHPDVYTFGRKSKDPIPAHLKNAVAVERGGEVTFHNPGQLVCYPVLTLQENERDIHLYLRRLEAMIISTLADFGIKSERRDGATGVWLCGREKKIASIGVALSSWVTYHGVALNVNNDLSGFSKIHPCGFSSDVMTSMKEQLGENCPSMKEVKASVLRHFAFHFHREQVV